MAFFLNKYMPTPARKWCRMLTPHRLEMIVSPCPAPMGTMSCKENGWFWVRGRSSFKELANLDSVCRI